MALRENKKFTAILAVALLGVWGVVGYRVITAVWGSSEEDASISTVRPVSHSQSEEFHYDVKTRDPFSFMPVAKRDTLKAKPKLPVPIPWSPPPFKLIGIIIDKTKRTAILEDATGETHYLAQKDTLAGVMILQIEPHIVRYSFKKEKREWILE